MAAPPLGAHVSIAGGMARAIERGADLGCEALQVFVKNASQWRGKPISDEEAAAFRDARAASPIGGVVAHASYLINLASPDRDLAERSRRALADELERCDRLGLDGLVVHPGAHMGAGVDRGIERIATSLDRVLERRPDGRTPVLLENTAGQGTVLGFELEQLAEIRARAAAAVRVGVCLDTAHAFAAGYPIHRPAGRRDLVSRAEALFGLERVGCLHLNDSKAALGSHRDRHENVGRGAIGAPLFRRLLRDRRLRAVPMILETPLGEDGAGHRRDLARLRAWRARKAAPSR